MNVTSDTALTIARGGMEITWRYAWAWFLIQLAIHRHFPLPVAVCAFITAAVLTLLPAGRNWRAYQKMLLQIAGFIPFALLIVHPMQYQTLPFFSFGWIGQLLLEARPIAQWLVLILTLFCLWLIWRGGRILVNSARLYTPVCMHFDKGLGLFFLLLIVKAFVGSKFGLNLQGRDIGFLTLAYFFFSLTAISIARNQSEVQKSFLAGHRGIGVILSISTLVTLLGAGATLLVYPYLYNAADSLLAVTKGAVQPIDQVLTKTLLFLFRPRERPLLPDEMQPYAQKMTDMDTLTVTDMDPQVVAGGESLFLSVVGWGLFGIIGMIVAGMLVYLLIYILRLLLKRSRDDTARPWSSAWLSDLFYRLAVLPWLVWRGWVSLLKGVDCAAVAYASMLRWGRRSGMDLIPSETPAEYGNRLMNDFPDLGVEIGLIVEAFNREVYGLTTTDRHILSRLRSAQRRMKRLRYWPSRIKVWFIQ